MKNCLSEAILLDSWTSWLSVTKHLDIILSVPFLLFSLIITVKKLDRERSDSGLLRHKQDLDHTLTVTEGSYWERSREECKSQRLGRTG